MDVSPGRLARLGLPLALLVGIAAPRVPSKARLGFAAALIAVWAATYARYRRRGIEATADEWEKLRTATPQVFARHYNECVPTVEEELDTWSDYHGHRHEMRYRLVGETARAHLPAGGVVVDIGCGSALAADHLAGCDATYIGLDFGGHHITSAAKRHRDAQGPLRTSFVRGDGERLPLASGSVDVVIFTEVIEHLLRPELAVWEIARVLKPGGVLVMTTNNASEMPLRFPLSDPFAYVEKAVGFHHDKVVSHRPWIWPEPVSAHLVAGDTAAWVPHTWHKQAETRRMFAAAGLETIRAGSFEFPPPQSRTARWLETRGDAGRRLVDAIERLCQATPMVNRLGCHLFMVARRTEGGAAEPPAGIWPGPFSG
ncbi:MAG TPA: methyltransferase domain-containing protein [Mycobacteriales bacterium]|nr:methyltransferase domain-containing protein [Mycobacteriales bacterium]HWC34249.1 methyltransferase domain-containing protein [Mycobacteriales bacterium]